MQTLTQVVENSITELKGQFGQMVLNDAARTLHQVSNNGGKKIRIAGLTKQAVTRIIIKMEQEFLYPCPFRFENKEVEGRWYTMIYLP